MILDRTAEAAYEAYREAYGLERPWSDVEKKDRYAWFDVIAAVIYAIEKHDEET